MAEHSRRKSSRRAPGNPRPAAAPSARPRVLVVVIAVGLVGAGWAFLRDSEKKAAARDLAAAEDLLARDPSQAAALLEDMERRGLDPVERRIVLAVAYGKMNDPRALAAARDATAAAPDSLRAHMALLTACTRVYDKPGAMAELRVAERLAPAGNTELCLFGAGYAASTHDYEAVEEQARRCVAVDPKLAQAWYYLGLALGQGSSSAAWSEAETSLRRSVALAADSYPAWLELGSVAIRLGRDADAVDPLERAHTLAAPLVAPPAAGTRQQLQDLIRIDHLLLKAYHRRGLLAKEEEMRRECDGLNERVQHPPAT
jgi:tetratricopeptide (TPR) repeat protein